MTYESDREMEALDKWLEATKTSKDAEYDEAIRNSWVVQDILNHIDGGE